ncbi:hypothetical protein D3C80_1779350 [compost metagenome]
MRPSGRFIVPSFAICLNELAIGFPADLFKVVKFRRKEALALNGRAMFYRGQLRRGYRRRSQERFGCSDSACWRMLAEVWIEVAGWRYFPA